MDIDRTHLPEANHQYQETDLNEKKNQADKNSWKKSSQGNEEAWNHVERIKESSQYYSALEECRFVTLNKEDYVSKHRLRVASM